MVHAAFWGKSDLHFYITGFVGTIFVAACAWDNLLTCCLDGMFFLLIIFRRSPTTVAVPASDGLLKVGS
jgi:hypothetical protein